VSDLHAEIEVLQITGDSEWPELPWQQQPAQSLESRRLPYHWTL